MNGQIEENSCETDSLYFIRVKEGACAPVRGSLHAAGLDISSADDVVIKARGRALVDTGISVAIPTGCYGRIAPRSGLAVKHGIDVGAGVIDSDYRGPVKVLLLNHSDNDFEVKKGMRIAQLICERIALPRVVETSQLCDTQRGHGGFGSTGV